jgi:hypothetical protein
MNVCLYVFVWRGGYFNLIVTSLCVLRGGYSNLNVTRLHVLGGMLLAGVIEFLSCGNNVFVRDVYPFVCVCMRVCSKLTINLKQQIYIYIPICMCLCVCVCCVCVCMCVLKTY